MIKFQVIPQKEDKMCKFMVSAVDSIYMVLSVIQEEALITVFTEIMRVLKYMLGFFLTFCVNSKPGWYDDPLAQCERKMAQIPMASTPLFSAPTQQLCSQYTVKLS